jgi:geranylgeranyl reductase family protein
MYDAVVVGGGPAGATLSRLLAERGAKVLLIEKEKMPRDKLCAGAVSLRAEPLLPPDWDNAVLNTIYGGNLGWRGERYVNARSEEPVVKIVDRRSFDLYLTLKAGDAGAEIREGEKFLNFLSAKGDFVEVVTDRGVYRTKYLVGADGALSRTLRVYGIDRKPTAVLEALVETRVGDMDEVFIDIGLVGWGYAWIFPKGDNLVSVGIASLKGERKNLRQLLEEYINTHPLLRGKRVLSVRGWFIPISRGSLIKGSGRVFLVGDASGATDAVLGEGIYYAVKQAHLLADCLLSENPERCYRKRVKSLEREFLFAYLTGFLAYNFQGFMFRHAKGEDLERFFEFLRGRLDYKDIWLYGVKKFLRSLLPF